MAFAFPTLPTLGSGFGRFGQTMTPEQQLLRTPLTDEEQQGILGNIGQAGLTGLSWLGNVLDTPGSVVRGFVSGQPDRALGGIFDWSQRVHGSDLTGMNDPNAGLLSGQTLGNIGTELALDPLTYLSLGSSAVTKLGQLAKKAGMLPKTGTLRAAGFAHGSNELGDFAKFLANTPEYAGRPVADIASEVAGKSLGGNLGIGLPFMPKATVDATPALNAIGSAISNIPVVGPALGGLGKAAGNVGRAARAALDANVKGAMSVPGQELGLGISAAERAANVGAHQTFQGLIDALPQNAFTEAGGRALRTAAEVPGTPTAFDPFVNQWQQVAKNNLQRLNDVGYPDQALADNAIDYFHRQVNPEIANRAAKLGMTPEKAAAREGILKNIPTEDLNSFFKEPLEYTNAAGQVVPHNKLTLADDIRTRLLGFDENTWRQLKAKSASGAAMTPAETKQLGALDAARVQAEGLADYKLDLGQLTGDYYNRHPLEDLMHKLLSDERRILQGEQLHQHIARAALPIAQAGPDAVRLDKVLERAGLTFNVGNPNGGTRGAMSQTIDALRKVTGNQALTEADLAKYAIPAEFATDISSITNKLTSPKAVRPFIDFITSITNATKAHQTFTLPWVGYHLRNFVSGAWQSFVHDGLDLKALQQAGQWRSGLKAGPLVGISKDIPAFAGMTDAAATKKLYELINQYDVPLNRGLEHMADVPPVERLNEIVPGMSRPGLKEAAQALKAPVKDYLNPFALEGVFGQTKDVYPLAKAGRITATTVDQNNRVAMFIAKLKQGFTPQAAADEVLKAHYDFGNLTDSERVLKSMIPFYSWCVPVENTEILTRDGWKTCDALAIGEEVLTYSMEKDCLEWQPCEDKSTFDFDGELWTWERDSKNRQCPIKIECTPNHKWPIHKNACTTKRPYGEYEYPAEKSFVEANDLRTTHWFIRTAEFRGEQESVLTTKQARLLGWALTDGHHRWKGNHLELVLYQHPNKFLDEVCEVADNDPRPSRHPNGTATVTVRKELAIEIAQYLDRQNLLSLVTRLSREAANAMYDAMYKADGGISAGRKDDYFACESDAEVRDAFRVLAFLLGRNTSVSDKGCYVNYKKYMGIKDGKRASKQWVGKVWCPTTANGTWIMRQHDHIHITGNSRKNIPAVIRELAQNPGGKMGTAIRVSGKLRGDNAGLLPSQLGRGVALPVGESAPGTDRYLSQSGLPFEDLGEMASNPLNWAFGSLNPLLKMPIEMATGRQLFSGRDLKDLYSPTGTNSTLLDQALMNSPLSRYMTAAKTVADPRKDIFAKLANLATGVRVTDVDRERTANTAARNLLEASLGQNAGARTFQNLYIPPEMLATLTPSQLNEYRMYLQLRQQARQAAQAKARAQTSSS